MLAYSLTNNYILHFSFHIILEKDRLVTLVGMFTNPFIVYSTIG